MKTIQLNEQQFRAVIEESVKAILKEYYFDAEPNTYMASENMQKAQEICESLFGEDAPFTQTIFATSSPADEDEGAYFFIAAEKGKKEQIMALRALKKAFDAAGVEYKIEKEVNYITFFGE